MEPPKATQDRYSWIEWLKTARTHLVFAPAGISTEDDKRSSTCYVLNVNKIRGIYLPQLVPGMHNRGRRKTPSSANSSTW